MTNEQIKQIFLANGFTEKPQAGGYTDLNPYVYEATRALLEADRAKAGRLLSHKKLHLTSLSVQLLGCSSVG